MGFTKGKWEIILWLDKRGFNIFSDEGLIATVPLEQGSKHTMHEVKANAYLIAAAPAMYEALKMSKGIMEALGVAPHAMKVVDKALALARGDDD